MPGLEVDHNPFDQTNNYQENAFQEDDGYQTIETNNSGPPRPPPPKPPSQPSAKVPSYDFNDDNDGYNQSNNSKITSNFQSFEVDRNQDPNNLHRGCFGYSPYIRLWAVGVGVVFLLAGILGLISLDFNLIRIATNIYLIFVGIWIVLVEIPANYVCNVNRSFQKRVFRWARLCRRIWGRACIYFFFALLCVSDKEESSSKVVFGAIVMALCFIMWIVSFQAATCAKLIYHYVTQNAQGADAEERWKYAFNDLTRHEDTLTAAHFQTMSRCAGRFMNESERSAVLRFFDETVSGDVSEWEFKKGMETLSSNVRFL